MDAAIDLLEKRIGALELQVLPKNVDPSALKSQTVVDYFLEAQEMITTALSCREVVTGILRRLPLIDEYLDPNCDLENAREIRKYVVELYPEIEAIVGLLKEFFALQPVLDVEDFVTEELAARCGKATVEAAAQFEESEETRREVREILKALHEMTRSYKELFAQLEHCMGAVEEAVEKAKKIIDD